MTDRPSTTPHDAHHHVQATTQVTTPHFGVRPISNEEIVRIAQIKEWATQKNVAHYPATARNHILALARTLLSLLRAEGVPVATGEVCGYTPGRGQVEIRLTSETLISGWLELGSPVHLAAAPEAITPADKRTAFEMRMMDNGRDISTADGSYIDDTVERDWQALSSAPEAGELQLFAQVQIDPQTPPDDERAIIVPLVDLEASDAGTELYAAHPANSAAGHTQIARINALEDAARVIESFLQERRGAGCASAFALMAAASEVRLHKTMAEQGAAGSALGDAQTDAARDVLAERHRQISVEGWTPEHDDAHTDGALAQAAACYAASSQSRDISYMAHLWPWSTASWKPGTSRGDLLKAGALILAEIERQDRARAAFEAQRKGDA